MKRNSSLRASNASSVRFKVNEKEAEKQESVKSTSSSSSSGEIRSVSGLSDRDVIKGKAPKIQEKVLSPRFEERIETYFSEETLLRLESHFSKGPLESERLKEILIEELQLERDYAEYTVPQFFSALDSYNIGKVSFKALCAHLAQEFEQRASWATHIESIELTTPAKVILPRAHYKYLPHRILEVGRDMHIMFAADGFVTFRSTELALRKSRTLKTREIEKELCGKWYIDAVVSEDFSKVIVSTGDKELQFYELPNLDPSSQLINIPSIANTVDCKTTAPDELTIVYGDWVGCVTVVVITDGSRTFRRWNERPKRLGIPTTTFSQACIKGEMSVTRWQVHSKRVVQVLYTFVMSQVISVSVDDECSLAIGCSIPPLDYEYAPIPGGMFAPRPRPEGEEVTFRFRHGQSSIDVWEEKRLLAAGGIDRVIRVWNLMVRGKILAMLKGHITPIVSLSFYNTLEILVSFGVSKNIRLWNMKDYNCLLLVTALSSQIRGISIYCCHCSKISNAVIVQTGDDMFALRFSKRRVDDESRGSHFGAVVGAAYNEMMSVWITCSTHQVKLWDIVTGKKKYEFQVVTEDSIEDPRTKKTYSKLNEIMKRKYEAVISERNAVKGSALSEKWLAEKLAKKLYFGDFNRPGDITCMHIDRKGMKLLTGHESGVVKEINFRNGMVLRNLCKGSATAEGSTITGVTFVHTNKGDNIAAVGWSKTVDVYGGPEFIESTPYSVLEAKEDGHLSDIWTVTAIEPGIVATGSYDGIVILWNFSSGHVEARLKPADFMPDASTDVNKVSALTFYRKIDESDEELENEIYLLTAGPGSCLHMWEIRWRKRHYFYRGSIRPWRSEERFLCSLAPSPKYELVLGGDDMGTVYVFSMKDVETGFGLQYNPRCFELNIDFYLRFTETVNRIELPIGYSHEGMPRFTKKWSAHVCGVKVLDICETYGLLITGDSKGFARIWNLHGDYIGMLGDGDWNIFDPSTYIHPKLPKDVTEDDRRRYEKKLDLQVQGIEEESIGSEIEEEDEYHDFVLTHEDISNVARSLTIHKKKLPPFLKYEKDKIVFRYSIYPQKMSLAPVYKHMLDSSLALNDPDFDNKCNSPFMKMKNK